MGGHRVDALGTSLVPPKAAEVVALPKFSALCASRLMPAAKPFIRLNHRYKACQTGARGGSMAALQNGELHWEVAHDASLPRCIVMPVCCCAGHRSGGP